MQLSGASSKALIAVLVLAVIGLGYFLWSKSAPAEPTIPPGQSLHNPLGEQSRVTLPQGQTAAPTAPGGRVSIPAPGTADPQLGMGPSQGARAHIPGSR